MQNLLKVTETLQRGAASPFARRAARIGAMLGGNDAELDRLVAQAQSSMPAPPPPPPSAAGAFGLCPAAGSAPPHPAGGWSLATVPAAPTQSEASVPHDQGQQLRSTPPQLRQQRHEHVHQPASRLRRPASWRPHRAGYTPRTASAERASTSTRGRARKRVQHARLAAAGLPALGAADGRAARLCSTNYIS